MASRSFLHRMARRAPAPARHGTALTLNGDQLDVGAFQYLLFAADANGQAGSWSLSTQAPPRRRPGCQRHRLHYVPRRSAALCGAADRPAPGRSGDARRPASPRVRRARHGSGNGRQRRCVGQRLGRRQPACLGPRDWRHHRQPGRRDAGRESHTQGSFQAGVHLFANPPWSDGACAGVMLWPRGRRASRRSCAWWCRWLRRRPFVSAVDKAVRSRGQEAATVVSLPDRR
ncbi:hypothetical protein SRS16P2_00519 (plasmid) [Variovorax sp. SRS16]|nr:hypothetical protein SRS16P2_00519 [Variovorax sp. SRS16]